MRCLVLGLGNFGAAIATKLTELGHEVIGVDTDINKVNNFKDKITYSVCFDSSNIQSINTLPIAEIDLAIVAIGEDFGSSVMTTALLKQLKVKRLICRAISQIHEAVFNAIGVDEIVHPEQETAERLAYRLHLQGVVDVFTISDHSMIVKAKTPVGLIGKTVEEANLNRKQLRLVTILGVNQQMNIFGKRTPRIFDLEDVTPQTIIEEGDVLVLYGSWHSLKEFLNE